MRKPWVQNALRLALLKRSFLARLPSTQGSSGLCVLGSGSKSSRPQVRLQVDSFFLDYATHRTKRQQAKQKEANNHQQTRTASDQGGWGISTTDIAELGDEWDEDRLRGTAEDRLTKDEEGEYYGNTRRRDYSIGQLNNDSRG